MHDTACQRDTAVNQSSSQLTCCNPLSFPRHLPLPPPPSPQLVVCTTDLDCSVSDNTHRFHFAQSARSIIVEVGGQLILGWITGVRFLGGPGNFLLIFLSSSLTVCADLSTIWKTTVLRTFRRNILPLSSGSNLVQQAIYHVTDARSEWPPACSLTVCSPQSLQTRPTYTLYL